MLLINKKIFAMFVTLFVLLTTACSSSSEQDTNMNEKYHKILGLVSVGMNIDEAANILKKNGFTVGQREYPTAGKEYSQILIPLSRTIPVSATVAETTGKGTGKNIYVIIKADSKDIIFEIYH